MKLYHGTTDKHIQDILREGLQPPFEDTQVSLTDDYELAVSYATDAANLAGGKPTVLTVLVSRAREGYLAEFDVPSVPPKDIVKVERVRPVASTEHTEIVKRLIEKRGE